MQLDLDPIRKVLPQDPETRAEHAAIKARIDSGESLPEAIFKYHLTKLDELDVHLRTQGMN
jgi:hypothetical protein